jgi:ATP-dependent RNA helicase SUPV3L1/SUV3
MSGFTPRVFAPNVRAILGPTNTGKTHLAIERLLAHSSGIIGFPLRLLARENYDRMVARKGARYVALITGEEKIVPPEARWFSCTVEAMPLDRPTEFLAVDEIQLCADPDRGHVFTDRLLHARGLVETMFLGAETTRKLLQRLVPHAIVETRPRLSQLTHAGPLPPRSAVVAFSAGEVYAIAEAIRRRRGGCAVVMGRLSPRTRNAQVALYQEKEVDFLVATDAIGMGLNMDVDHVAFARLSKFDGHRPRPLTAAEMGQIAGRAGRGMRDGTFGSTATCPPLPELRGAGATGVAQQRPRFLRPRRPARQPGRAAARTGAEARQRCQRPGDTDRAGPRGGDTAHGVRRARDGAAAVGGLPNPGFPQAGGRHACAAVRAGVHPSGPKPACAVRLAGRADRGAGPDRG